MNESHQKLYDLLIDQKLYSKSYDEFTSQFEDEEKQQKLYDLIQQQNLYSKSYDEFTQQFFSQKKRMVHPNWTSLHSVGVSLET